MTKRNLALGTAFLALAVSAFPIRSDAEDVRTELHLDPKHPFKIHWEFYPPESVRLNEQGKCWVAVFVDRSGLVRAAQLNQSSGFTRLDAACLVSVQGQRMIPATLNGEPVGAWATMPIVWGAEGDSHHVPHVEDNVPVMRKEYELKVGPEYYPPDARPRKQAGICLIYASVGPGGAVAATKVLKSTGSASLDRASTAALAPAQFVPAKKDGAPVRAGTLLALFWAL